MVAMEEVRQRGKGSDATRLYGAYSGQICQFYEDAGVPLLGVGPGQIKRHVTGKGNAKKEAVMSAVEAAFGIDLGGDDDAGDAIGAAWLASTGLS